jgi:hypothetical protein
MKRLLRVVITTVVVGLGLVGIIGPAQKADALDAGTLSISVSPNPSVQGQGVIFSATVTGGSGIPTGFVNFIVDGQSTCTAPLSDGSGDCSGLASSFNQGAEPLGVQGVYSGDTVYAQTTASINEVVNPDSTTTTLSSAVTQGAYGPQVSYTALVSPVAPGAGPIYGGTVDFSVNGDTFCTETVASGTSVCPAEAASDNVVATFSGTSEFLGSSSAPLTTTIPEIATSVQVAPDPSTATFGQMVTYNVGVLTSGGIASGTVGVSIAGVALCSASVSEGSGSCTSANAPVGVDTITATFYDESHVFGESTATSTITVLPQQTSTSAPIVGMAATSSGNGYWLVGSDGAVYAYGDARSFGSLAGRALNAPIVGIAATPDGGGYWLVGKDGGVFSFGDAQFYGSTGDLHLNKPVVGMAATADGKGYWFVASDGGIFTYGDAVFHGSMGGTPLNKPVVGMAADLDTGGYWLVASDGGVFSFGAPFYGSTGSLRLNEPIVGMEASPLGTGYRFVASDGGVFSFDLPYSGSMGGQRLNASVVGVAASGSGAYWLVAQDGGLFTFGGAPFEGSPG